MESKWTKVERPDEEEYFWLRFEAAPIDQGQIVEAAYAIDLQDNQKWMRLSDRSDRPGTPPTYYTRPLTEREITEESHP